MRTRVALRPIVLGRAQHTASGAPQRALYRARRGAKARWRDTSAMPAPATAPAKAAAAAVAAEPAAATVRAALDGTHRSASVSSGPGPLHAVPGSVRASVGVGLRSSRGAKPKWRAEAESAPREATAPTAESTAAPTAIYTVGRSGLGLTRTRGAKARWRPEQSQPHCAQPAGAESLATKTSTSRASVAGAALATISDPATVGGSAVALQTWNLRLAHENTFLSCASLISLPTPTPTRTNCVLRCRRLRVTQRVSAAAWARTYLPSCRWWHLVQGHATASSLRWLQSGCTRPR